MAIISGSALGNFKNKFGNAVTAKWLNKNVARIYQPDVSNPKTNPQKLVRARFTAAVKTAAGFGTFLRSVTRGLARSLGMTVYGWFVKENWDYVSASSPDNVTVDFSSLVLSQGSVEKVSTGTVDWGTTEHLTITTTWTAQTQNNDCDDNDDVYFVAYSEVLGEAVISSPMPRSTLSVGIVLPSSFNGLDVHLYGAVVGRGTNTAGRISDSWYLGHSEVQ